MGDTYSYDNTDNRDFLASSNPIFTSRQDLAFLAPDSSSFILLLISFIVTACYRHSAKSSHATARLCSSHATLENTHASYRSSLFQDGISIAVDSSIGVGAPNDGFLFSLGTYALANMKGGSIVNMPSSSFRVSENEFDEYDCESEVMLLVSKIKGLV